MKQKHTGTAIKRTRGDVVFDVINALLLLIVMLVVAYPLVYAISCSFSSPLLVVQSKVYLLPKGLTTIAYERVFNNHQILTGYKNTVFYTLLGTAINIILTTMTAYPLSRRDFKARKFITFLFTFTMLFSGGLIPTFLVVRNLGLMNTVWALILPGAISSWNPGIAGHVFKQYQPFAALGFVGIHQGQLRLVAQNFNNGALTQINLRARHAHGGVVQILDVVGCIHRPGLGRVGAGIGHIVHILGQRGAVAVLLGGDDDGIGADFVKLCLEGEIARGVQAGGVQILIGRGNGDRSARNGGAADGH